jgi:uncharacterized protein (DUF2147 family)
MARATVFAVLLAAATAGAAPDEAVFGLWAGAGSIIEVAAHEGRLTARIVALKDPIYLEGEPYGPVGAARRDDRNPEQALRDRPLIGVELLSGYVMDDGEWQVRVYDPESGKTYSSKMWVEDGVLHMRGYIGFSLVGRTATFAPVASCTPHVIAMLARAAMSGC